MKAKVVLTSELTSLGASVQHLKSCSHVYCTVLFSKICVGLRWNAPCQTTCCLLRLLFRFNTVVMVGNKTANWTKLRAPPCEVSVSSVSTTIRLERVDIRYQVSSVSTCRHKVASFERVDLSTFAMQTWKLLNCRLHFYLHRPLWRSWWEHCT